MQEKGKKILLVAAYAPPARVGAGVAMYHLISNIPHGTFAVLTEERGGHGLAGDKQYMLDCGYYYYNSSKINPISSQTTSPQIVSGQNNVDWQSLIKDFFILCRRIPGIRFIGQLIVVARHIMCIVQAGDLAIKKENPTMVVGYSDGGPVLIASYLLSIKHRIPLSLYFYDLYKGNYFTRALSLYAYIFEPFMLRRATHIFVMNDLLRDVYRLRSKKCKVTVIYNSLPEHEHGEVVSDSGTTKSIAYLGSIYWAQESALKELIEASSLLRNRPKIILYTPYTDEYLNGIGIYESENIIFSSCDPENSIKELEKHSLTFLGLSHNTEKELLINTSSPVRLCDYLNARVPMLIHAPAESFVVKHALTHDFAFVSTAPLVEKLAVVLQEALTGQSREEKVKNANIVAKLLHNPKSSAKIFSDTVFQNVDNKTAI